MKGRDPTVRAFLAANLSLLLLLITVLVMTIWLGAR